MFTNGLRWTFPFLRRIGFLNTLGAVTFLFAGVSLAQEYPTKPIRILIGFSPGGGVDMLTRITASKLYSGSSISVIVENRSGANGQIAAEFVSKSAPDGYTLLSIPGNYAFATAMGAMPIDMMKVFSGVSQLADSPLLLVVHPSVPAKDVLGLVALAKAKPGQLSYASGGTGGAGHLAMELFKSMAKIDLVHVPYKGIGPGITDLVGGHVPVCLCTLPPSLKHAQAGKLRALGVSSSTRSPVALEIPTISEAGIKGYEMDNWHGLLAPLGTPSSVIGSLNGEVKKALAMPDVKQRFAADGARPVWSTPNEFESFYKSEVSKWTKVVKSAGLVANSVLIR